MEFKKFGNNYVVRLDRGEEIVETLKQFCEDQKIKLGVVSGIGATDKISIGLYDVKKKEYFSKEYTGDYEIAPVVGNITTMNDEVYLHLHVNICDAENRSFGGHLSSAVVSATFEGHIQVIDGEVGRKKDEELGLNLMEF